MAVCTTSQFTTSGGILGLDRSAQARIVSESTQASTGDGPVTSNPGIPGRVLIEQRAHWVNDYGVPVQIQVQIQRARRTMYVSSPNYMFIRERYTYVTGYDTSGPILAPTPTVDPTWQTEWGGGIDVGVKGSPAVPNYGKFRLSTPESVLFVPLMRLEIGQSVDVRFRASLVNPYVWWTNAPSQVGEMLAFSNTILIMAFPEVI